MAKLTKQQLHQIQTLAKARHKREPKLPYSKCVKLAYSDWQERNRK